MEYLERTDIILINQMTIKRHGGHFIPPENLLNEDRLEYAIDAVRQVIFGEKLHKTIPDIAAAYMFYIVTGHIFQDGNKRTGLEAALLFLGLNDFKISGFIKHVILESGKPIPGEDAKGNWIIFQLTIELAAGELGLDELKAWFTQNIVAKPTT